jgi:hypothetical protein
MLRLGGGLGDVSDAKLASSESDRGIGEEFRREAEVGPSRHVLDKRGLGYVVQVGMKQVAGGV